MVVESCDSNHQSLAKLPVLHADLWRSAAIHSAGHLLRGTSGWGQRVAAVSQNHFATAYGRRWAAVGGLVYIQLQ